MYDVHRKSVLCKSPKEAKAKLRVVHAGQRLPLARCPQCLPRPRLLGTAECPETDETSLPSPEKQQTCFTTFCLSQIGKTVRPGILDW